MSLEVVQFRKAGDKWKPVRLGGAKKNEKGQLNVYLDALPLGDENGNVRFVIQERQERRDFQAPEQTQQQLDDDIPF